MSRAARAEAEVARLHELLGSAGVATGPAVAEVDPRDELILRRILAEAATERPAPAGRRVARHRVAWRVAAAAASVAVVAGVLTWQADRQPAVAQTPALLEFSAASPADVLAGQTRPAHDVLVGLADVAAVAGPADGEGDQVVTSYGWYLNSVGNDDGSVTVELAPTAQTTTLRPDGSFDNVERHGPALGLDGRVVDPGRYPVGDVLAHDDLPAGTLDAQLARNLPRDPAALRAALLAQQPDAGCDGPEPAAAACLFRATVDLYTRYVVPADLSAALWRVLADEPGLTELGATTDRLGRDGVAVAVTPVPGRTPQLLVLIADPTTGALREWEEVNASVPEVGVHEPAVIAFQAISRSEWRP